MRCVRPLCQRNGRYHSLSSRVFCFRSGSLPTISAPTHSAPATSFTALATATIDVRRSLARRSACCSSATTGPGTKSCTAAAAAGCRYPPALKRLFCQHVLVSVVVAAIAVIAVVVVVVAAALEPFPWRTRRSRCPTGRPCAAAARTTSRSGASTTSEAPAFMRTSVVVALNRLARASGIRAVVAVCSAVFAVTAVVVGSSRACCGGGGGEGGVAAAFWPGTAAMRIPPSDGVWQKCDDALWRPAVVGGPDRVVWML